MIKRKCTNCGSNLDQFNIDYEAGKIQCIYCSHPLPDNLLTSDFFISSLAKKIPEYRRDEFMAKLGFKKKEVKLKNIFLSFFLGFFPLLFSIDSFRRRQENPIKILIALSTCIILLIPLIKFLLLEKSGRYVKTGEEDPGNSP